MYQLLIIAFQTSLAMTANETTIPIPCNSTKHSFRDSSYDTNIDEDRNRPIPELDKSNTCYRRNIGGIDIGRTISPFHGIVEADYNCQDAIEGIMANITKKRRYDISLEYTAHIIASEYANAYLKEWDAYNMTLNEAFLRATNEIDGEDAAKKMQEIAEKKKPENMAEHVKNKLEPRYPLFVVVVVSVTDSVGDAFLKIAAEIRAQRTEVSQVFLS
ncbi:unnamed protein product [Cylicocyclus nassatus]|uniref:Uncharacterized protein n=1 Tax=Cylicocyclus nassatus TaxID=53992 RepID=A0AA36GRV8_CYLNA|nr:unnamed protein product [Cylicocyclus nassatus]